MIRAVVVSLLLAVPAVAEDKVVTPEEAVQMVGKTVTVEMKVLSTGLSDTGAGILIHLQSKLATDRKGNFEIQLAPGVVKVDKADDAFKFGHRVMGQMARAKGKVEVLRGGTPGWYIYVKDPADFKVVEKK